LAFALFPILPTFKMFRNRNHQIFVEPNK